MEKLHSTVFIQIFFIQLTFSLFIKITFYLHEAFNLDFLRLEYCYCFLNIAKSNFGQFRTQNTSLLPLDS